jgi:hypothetical protein
MEVSFWTRRGDVIERKPFTPAAGFVKAPDGTDRVTVYTDPTSPQVWLLSVDGRREYCAWTEAAAWDHDHDGVRVLVVAEYSDGRVMARTFCAEHAQQWAEELTPHFAIHDMRYPTDIPSTD